MKTEFSPSGVPPQSGMQGVSCKKSVVTVIRLLLHLFLICNVFLFIANIVKEYMECYRVFCLAKRYE